VVDLPEWVQDRVSGGSVSPGARRVIEVLDLQPQIASYASTADMARRAGVNEATVVRTAQLLGFQGWPALRLEVRSRYLASLSAGQVLNEHLAHSRSSAADAIRQDVANLESLIRGMDVEEIAAVAALLTSCRRGVVVGSGSFAAPGLQLAHLAQTMGYDLHLQAGGATALFNDAALLGEDDCLVVMSFWWVPKHVVAAAEIARDNGCSVVLVSDRRTSPVAPLARHTLIAPSEGTSLFPSLTAPMAVVHCILAEMVSRDEDKVRATVERNEQLWRKHDLFDFSR
jgi:DNA-binding MurR/RpiR family transcriptional regulator